jgi:predicted dehydrogenase
MIRAGVIGYGYWGPNIVRNFRACGAIDLACVCDTSPEQLAAVRAAHPGLSTTSNIADVFADKSLDAVAIITPVASHFELGMAALRAGKDVWIEKPVTASTDEAQRLCDEADRRKRVLFVDHTFLYTGAVGKLRQIGRAGGIGHLVSYTSERANLGRYRPDVNVLWDLAVHDVAILDYALGARVLAVSATGIANVRGMPEASAFLTGYLDEGAILHVHADWFSPRKARTTTITGDRRMVVYDDNEPVEKVRVYDRGVVVERGGAGAPRVTYREGSLEAPELVKTEALTTAASHFADCVERRRTPITDGELGLRVVRVLEAAALSMKGRGRPVEIAPF